MTNPLPSDKDSTRSSGHDGPISDRSGDHLNRWPFAREIYGVATTGPEDWSVRIGVYGEWGTGKTSILDFITTMAKHDGHTVIRFNPWQHSSRDTLWCDFVTAIYNQPIFYSLERAGWVRTKKKVNWVLNRGNVAKEGAAVVNATAGKVVAAGLEIAKEWFLFTENDLAAVRKRLGDKRVIILIDDLDRTARELVPEILFALKEIMNAPAFSFICAFDPTVVGRVLGDLHPGFGDGLKFLDKIIDYPRWLPLPSHEALTKMAIADVRHSCPFVPESVISDAVKLLPANPRAIRQFIRILALLKPQIKRHHERELHWPAIITATILKVRHPRIAHELLNARDFWESIEAIGLGARGEEKGLKTTEAVEEHITKVCSSVGVTLETSHKSEIMKVMVGLCGKFDPFGGLRSETISYQFNVGEVPTAVTWKEFDAFLPLWRSKETPETIQAWIKQHASRVERLELEVYRELLRGAVERYAEVLRKADYGFIQSEADPLINEASSILALLDVLVFDMGQLNEREKRLGQSELQLVFKHFASFADGQLPVHKQFWPRNQDFISRLVRQWGPDVRPLVRLLRPYTGFRAQIFEGKGSSQLRRTLCELALPILAAQSITDFLKDSFVEDLFRVSEDFYETRCLILDADGPFWGLRRSEVFRVLEKAPSNPTVQANAFHLLYWFCLASENEAPWDFQAFKKLFAISDIFAAVWKAAVCAELAPRAVYQIRSVPELVKNLGIDCSLPNWWTPILSIFVIPDPASQAPNPAATSVLDDSVKQPHG